MAFVPKINVCLTNSCEYLQVTDVTGEYDANTNTEGWGDNSTLQESDVDKIEIIIEFPDGSKKTVDVTSQLPSDVKADVQYNDISGDFSDGIYNVIYKIKDTSGNKYKDTVTTIFACHVSCCVTKIFAKAPDELCDCDHDIFLRDALQAKGLLRTLKAMGACNKTKRVNDIIKRINRICAFNDCKCN